MEIEGAKEEREEAEVKGEKEEAEVKGEKEETGDKEDKEEIDKKEVKEAKEEAVEGETEIEIIMKAEMEKEAIVEEETEMIRKGMIKRKSTLTKQLVSLQQISKLASKS